MVAALVVLVGAAPAPAAPIDDYRRNGTIDPCKYSDGQLKRGLQNLPPDVEQYSPGLADQLNAGRQGCGSTGTPDNRQSEAVPAPSAPGNGGGGGAAGGATDRRVAEVPDPPSPTVAPRQRLADVATPRVSSRIDQDPPGWVTPLLLILLGVAVMVAVVRLTGASTQRFTRPLGAAFSHAGARTSDSMAQLWDRVRLGR